MPASAHQERKRNAASAAPALLQYSNTARLWALNSAVECHLHTVEVIGSNPIAPTILLASPEVSLFHHHVLAYDQVAGGHLAHARHYTVDVLA